MLPETEDEIPPDGSVGGHYTMEEVTTAGGGRWVGEASPYAMSLGVILYLLGSCLFMYWLNGQPWVPELM